MTKFFKTINDYNLCTYYVLPLLKLSKHSFGHQNFVQCYMDEKRDVVIVELQRLEPFLYNNNDYIDSYYDRVSDHVFIILRIPPEWEADVKLFRLGKYSLFSTNAKNMIRSFSQLQYKQLSPVTNKVRTDARLMALDESPVVRKLLRDKLEEELGCSIPESNELISIPSDSNYIAVPDYEQIET